MKNITLALVIALGFCAIEVWAQISLRQRQDREFEALIVSGNAEQKRKQFEEEASKSRAALDKMLALEEKSKSLSADAFTIYTQRVDMLRREYETCSNRLARVRAMLTPEKIVELANKKRAAEEAKARKEKAKKEYAEFAAGVDDRFVGDSEREKEREEQRAQLMQIQEELRKAREARDKAKEEK